MFREKGGGFGGLPKAGTRKRRCECLVPCASASGCGAPLRPACCLMLPAGFTQRSMNSSGQLPSTSAPHTPQDRTCLPGGAYPRLQGLVSKRSLVMPPWPLPCLPPLLHLLSSASPVFCISCLVCTFLRAASACKAAVQSLHFSCQAHDLLKCVLARRGRHVRDG